MREMISGLSGTSIFVVEDEAIVALDLQTMLEDAGAEVVGPVGTLPEAEMLSQNENISLAILDVRLNQDAITTVADRLSARRIPIIFHTGHSTSEILTVRWPGCKVLHKPVDPLELMAIVCGLLGRSPKAINE
ncbi:MAG TPA: response regulator [Hyphomicrobiales bacterium]|jgi:DNA-binding response OmpR family regulator